MRRSQRIAFLQGVRSTRVFEFMGGVMPGGALLTRASTGWSFNSTPALASASTDVPRFAYSPAGGGLLGLLNEPPATNSLLNDSSTTGGVTGSPGTLPNSRNASPSGTNNLTRTVVGFGTEDGIPCMDVQWAGVPNATTSLVFAGPSQAAVAAALGQTWISSSYARLLAGSLSNVTMDLDIIERNSGGTPLTNTNAAFAPTSAPLRTQLVSAIRTLNQATTVSVDSYIALRYTNGAALDLTLRIGLPQLVQASAATSPIFTTGTVVTRAADVLSLAMANGTYSIDIVRASGTTSLTGQVVSGGAYTVPTDPSPLQRVIARRTA